VLLRCLYRGRARVDVVERLGCEIINCALQIVAQTVMVGRKTLRSSCILGVVAHDGLQAFSKIGELFHERRFGRHAIQRPLL
jgi:hypothetical protein